MFYKILMRKSTEGCLNYFSRKIAMRFPRSFSHEDAKQELTLKLLEAYNNGSFTDQTDDDLLAYVYVIVKSRAMDILCPERAKAKRCNMYERSEELEEYSQEKNYDKVVYSYTGENGFRIHLHRSELDAVYLKVSGTFAESELMSRKNAGIILKMIAEGYTHSDIADEIGVTAMYVRKLRNEYVLPEMRRELYNG